MLTFFVPRGISQRSLRLIKEVTSEREKNLKKYASSLAKLKSRPGIVRRGRMG